MQNAEFLVLHLLVHVVTTTLQRVDFKIGGI
jgi:hypothetical protein